MHEAFEPIDDVEIVELKNLLERVRAKDVNDGGALFIAQLSGFYRLATSQHDANKKLIEGQQQGHFEMLAEQKRLVCWQKWATLATVLMVITTAIYTYETHLIVSANIKMVAAAQEQLEFAKQQIHESHRPR